MYYIKTQNHVVELKAKARFYREFKNAIGCANLKAAFFAAYETLDVDFLAKWIVAFASDRTTTAETALDVIDECFEEGKLLPDLYADCADFLNGMGFFGKLGLSEGESAIDYFEDTTNKINVDEKIAAALDSGMTGIVNKMVAERMETKEQETKEQ